MAWAVFDETGTEVVLRHHLVIPDGFTIPRDATAIHGITTAEARRKGVPIEAMLTKLVEDINRHVPNCMSATMSDSTARSSTTSTAD